MARRTPELQSIFGVDWAAKSLFVEEDGSRFEPLIGDPGDGASPSCAIIDEFHEHATANQYDTQKTGMGARAQPLLLVITTAGSNIAGPCHDLQIEAQKVLEGIVDNDALFAIVYTIDEKDDWTTEAALRKANPNYDVSVSGTFLQKQVREAVQQASKQNLVKTKHLNIWVGAATAWMNMQAWAKCADPSLRLEEFLKQDCYEGADLSAKVDITARVRVFVRLDDQGRKHYYVFGRYYLPAEKILDPKCQHYQRWAHEGALVAIPGAEIDYGVIKADILADSLRFHLRCVAFDPWSALQLQQELRNELPEDTVIDVPQQVRFLSDPMKELEAAVLSGRLHHDGDKPLAWAMSNVVARVDANGNIFPRKEREENKIDPAAALINAISRAMLATPKKKSVYSSRGLVTV
jgi:phage terminase large subunit-like protein